jgi:hypothetical protein
MSTPKETNAERRARREREDYEDRLKSNAEEAAKEFAEIKAQAFKLKAEAQAAITEAGVALARVKAYENHLNETYFNNALNGTNYYPLPYSCWGWEECVLCHNEIRDDPHGHNAAPLANGICCSECNHKVVRARPINRLYERHQEVREEIPFTPEEQKAIDHCKEVGLIQGLEDPETKATFRKMLNR